jgi:hypothetical protein
VNEKPAEKVVLHFSKQHLLKGYLADFNSTAPLLTVYPAGPDPAAAPVPVNVHDLKAIFYVRSFEGNPDYREETLVGGREWPALRIMKVRFRDGETLAGYVSDYDPEALGFWLSPIDLNSNNARVFVLNASVVDVWEVPHRSAVPRDKR